MTGGGVVTVLATRERAGIVGHAIVVRLGISREEFSIVYTYDTSGSGISVMSNLVNLKLDVNNFTGAVPEGLYELTKLTRLRIMSNTYLTVSFTERLTALKGLEELAIGL